MSKTSNTPRGGVIRQCGKWTTAAAVVVTEAAQRTVDPESTIGVFNDHANTGAIWSLGLQIVAMCAVNAYKTLKLRGSITLSWGERGDGGGAPANGENGA